MDGVVERWIRASLGYGVHACSSCSFLVVAVAAAAARPAVFRYRWVCSYHALAALKVKWSPSAAEAAAPRLVGAGQHAGRVGDGVGGVSVCGTGGSGASLIGLRRAGLGRGQRSSFPVSRMGTGCRMSFSDSWPACLSWLLR